MQINCAIQTTKSNSSINDTLNGPSVYVCTFLYCPYVYTYFAADSEGVQLAVKVNIATVDVLEDKEDISQES